MSVAFGQGAVLRSRVAGVAEVAKGGQHVVVPGSQQVQRVQLPGTVHPNDAGHAAIAEVFDLGLFRE
ncbi:hypothetical protein [Amycolatopsis aidingensis]|uniref:hypothetical protein n=1 Tax=Amycolatopsis aidingensis TaxID=2842453 RepID=UPI001C0BD604|nr:hypothetical protein [Amycolatopsis aidingensis]